MEAAVPLLLAEYPTLFWLASGPLERTQFLFGRAAKTTTEIYIKPKWTGTAQPNASNIQ